MPRFTIHTVLLLIILSSNIIFSYSNLYVLDPRTSWWGGQGTIEDAVLSVHPQGLYLEYNLYLTFSARNLSFTNDDTLEVQYNFNLPDGAIVTDLWLWIGDDIMKALIIDKWTASNIYENIVKRRRDPALLIKQYDNQYELKVFPMPGKESRKVKITYLMPATWQSNLVTAAIPFDLLNCSNTPLSKLSLLVWPDENWEKPSFIENSDITFTSKYDSIEKRYMEAQIPSSSFYSTLTLAFNSPMRDGIYVNRYENDLEGYYQLVIQPSKLIDFNYTRKLAVLLDYTAMNSSFPITDVISNLKTMLHLFLTEKDSFNIILSKLDVYSVSDNWLSADSLSIETAFSNLGSTSIANYSNLTGLLNKGIDFVKDHGNNGEILLISNSDQFGSYESANELTKDLLEKMEPKIKISVMDYQNNNYNYYYINGMYYYGNEYFYTNLTKLTKGYYSNLRNIYYLNELMLTTFQSLNGNINSFDLYTTVDNGFCYGRFNINFNDGPVYIGKPLIQTGKYTGSLPLSIQVSGVYNNQPFTRTIQKQLNEIHAADSNIQRAWSGSYINSLEKQQQTNQTIGEIIDFSIDNRVLSLYTAFLALEPNDTISFCKDCRDESEIPSDVKDDDLLIPDSLSLRPYPNPFNAETHIAVTLPKNFKLNEATFRIYNILGEAIKSFDLAEIGTSRSFQLDWNGKSDNGVNAASGVYFFVVTSPQGNHSVKLMLLK